MPTVHTWDAYPSPDDLPPVVINDANLPLVSIVTPSYNQAQFIRQTIESVLAQDYPNIEYWVVDGSSTDETLVILKSYDHDPRFHWLSEKDAGQSDAINKGWSRCRGEIVAWLNSDDTYLPNALRMQVSFLREHLDIDLVFGDCIFTDPQGTPVETGYGRPFTHRDLLRFTIPHQPTVFLTRQAMQTAGPLDLSFHHSMDSEYWLRIHDCGFRLAYNPQAIATYRWHSGSKTGASHTQAYADWRRLIERYAPPRERPAALADLDLAIAIDEVRAGHLRHSLSYARRGLATRLTPRGLLYGAAVVDQLTGSSLYRLLVDYAQASRRRSTREIT